jgi:hypothetical protein
VPKKVDFIGGTLLTFKKGSTVKLFLFCK